MARRLLGLFIALAFGPHTFEVSGIEDDRTDKYYDIGTGEADGIQDMEPSKTKPWTETPRPQALSSWEMHVLNELLFEISLRRCQHIDQSKARAVKHFVAEKLARNTDNSGDEMSPEFYIAYRKLVHCMEYLREESGSHDDLGTGFTRPSEPVKHELIAKASSPGPDATPPPAAAKSKMPEGKKAKDESLWDEFSRMLISTMKWLKFVVETNKLGKLLGFHGSGNENEIPLPELLGSSSTKVKRSPRSQAGRSRKNPVRSDLQKLYSTLTTITINSCPAKARPRLSFAQNSIQQILTALSPYYDLVSNFHLLRPDSKLWTQVKECAVSSSRNPTDAEFVMDENTSRNKQ